MGPDNRLDVVVSLVAYGSYPNVCFHKEKRKILTTEGRNALIHKSSVNCPFSSHDISYPSPFFVFSEKVQLPGLICPPKPAELRKVPERSALQTVRAASRCLYLPLTPPPTNPLSSCPSLRSGRGRSRPKG